MVRVGVAVKNLDLFVKAEPREAWRDEWEGMPEFEQEQQRPYATLVVRFRTDDDLRRFAELIGQRLNRNSQATWFPELARGELQGAPSMWVDESDAA